MPEVRKGESSQDYVSRCIPRVMAEGKTKEQAAGQCYGMLREKRGRTVLTKKG